MATLSKEHQELIKWALSSFSSTRSGLFQTYANYYGGQHSLLFASKKFLETFGTTFRANTENLCRLPVDILADLLQVTGFEARAGDSKTVAADTQEIWRRNRMEERAGWVHKNTPLYGESFVIVWPDEEGEPTIYPNLPGNVVVKYHSEKLGYITQAAKLWSSDGFLHLTIYTPEMIYRFRTKVKSNGIAASYAAFVPYETDDILAETSNEYSKVPVFRFVNNAGVGEAGESELRDIIPPQDRLNKGLCDLLLAAEYAAYPQKYALGYEAKKDANGVTINPFKAGPERMWAITGKDVQIGQLDAANLQQYLDMIADARMAIARISGIPPHYFGMDSGGWPSGESLKTASERLTRKVLDRQASYGNTWADVMRFCLQIKGKQDIELQTNWENPTPRLSELDSWNAALLEQNAGGSKTKTLKDRGYSQEQIDAAAAAALSAELGDGFPAPKIEKAAAAVIDG